MLISMFTQILSADAIFAPPNSAVNPVNIAPGVTAWVADTVIIPDDTVFIVPGVSFLTLFYWSILCITMMYCYKI